ncbi:hypothetical protein HKCCE3408_19475, partial [Rhodobacterales bacterium HKCCE3408]|nr:hypothetical protein [Rhodobacterales bacterium HKCCE3408]
MRLIGFARGALQRQRGALLPWCPVFLGLGVAAYFALPAEPGPGRFAALAAVSLLAALAGMGW